MEIHPAQDRKMAQQFFHIQIVVTKKSEENIFSKRNHEMAPVADPKILANQVIFLQIFYNGIYFYINHSENLI